MNLNELLSIAKALGLNNQRINQAVNLSKNYSQDLQGLKKAVESCGGMNTVNRALEFAENPLVKMGLGKLGINTATLHSIKNELSTPTSIPSSQRLEKLKQLK